MVNTSYIYFVTHYRVPRVMGYVVYYAVCIQNIIIYSYTVVGKTILMYTCVVNQKLKCYI